MQKITDLYGTSQLIYFLDQDLNPVRVQKIEKVPYSGRIYDVTVDNHIILVRRIPPDLRAGWLERSGAERSGACGTKWSSYAGGVQVTPKAFEMPPKVPSAAMLPRTSEATGAGFPVVWSGNSYGGGEIDASGETGLVGYWRFNNDSAVGECYDNETEILTTQGWKHFRELNGGEKVATLNPETWETEFHKPWRYQNYSSGGSMYRIETEQGDLLVSPGHKVYAAAYQPSVTLKPSSSTSNKLPLNPSTSTSSKTPDKAFIIFSGSGGWILNTTIPKKSPGGNIEVSRKSESLLSSTDFLSFDRDATLPFTIPFGPYSTGNPLDSKNLFTSFGIFSSSRNLKSDIVLSSNNSGSMLQGSSNHLSVQAWVLSNDFFVRPASSNQLNNVRDQNPGSLKGGLPVTDFSVRDNPVINFGSHDSNMEGRYLNTAFSLQKITDLYEIDQPIPAAVIDYISAADSYPNDNNWHHVAFVYDQSLASGNAIVYLDGVNKGTGSKGVSTPSTSNSTGFMRIGMDGDGLYYPFNGTIDSVRIYNRSLLAEEVMMHYQSEFQKYNSTEWRFYYNETNLADGTYTYYGWANDTAGNTGETGTRAVTIDTTPAQHNPNISRKQQQPAGGHHLDVDKHFHKRKRQLPMGYQQHLYLRNRHQLHNHRRNKPLIQPHRKK